jgi:uncharacterized protein (TIGR02391 family)
MSSSNNRRVRAKIPANTKLGRDLLRQLTNSHILENRLIPPAPDESQYDIFKRMVGYMEQAGFEKRHIYAYVKTNGMLVTEANIKKWSEEDKREWIEAIEEYERLVTSGALQPSDSLVPFIQASKEILNPRKSKTELEYLFDGRNFHKDVVEASRNQFVNYAFPDSVFSAYRKLLICVQHKSGNFSDDGLNLITSVFSPKNPILQSGLARITKDSSIQEGIMHLFMGAVLSVRNVFAHKDVYITDVDDTIDYLSFASFLFDILDVMERIEDRKKIE